MIAFFPHWDYNSLKTQLEIRRERLGVRRNREYCPDCGKFSTAKQHQTLHPWQEGTLHRQETVGKGDWRKILWGLRLLSNISSLCYCFGAGLFCVLREKKKKNQTSLELSSLTILWTLQRGGGKGILNIEFHLCTQVGEKKNNHNFSSS